MLKVELKTDVVILKDTNQILKRKRMITHSRTPLQTLTCHLFMTSPNGSGLKRVMRILDLVTRDIRTLGGSLARVVTKVYSCDIRLY